MFSQHTSGQWRGGGSERRHQLSAAPRDLDCIPLRGCPGLSLAAVGFRRLILIQHSSSEIALAQRVAASRHRGSSRSLHTPNSGLRQQHKRARAFGCLSSPAGQPLLAFLAPRASFPAPARSLGSVSIGPGTPAKRSVHKGACYYSSVCRACSCSSTPPCRRWGVCAVRSRVWREPGACRQPGRGGARR